MSDRGLSGILCCGIPGSAVTQAGGKRDIIHAALSFSCFRVFPRGFFSCTRAVTFCSCQVRNKKKLIFFINGEPLARFPMLLLYNFVFSLLLLIIPSSSLKVIKVPSDFNMLIIIHQHIINEISDYFFIKLIQLTKLC